jgi:hypothetical protein
VALSSGAGGELFEPRSLEEELKPRLRQLIPRQIVAAVQSHCYLLSKTICRIKTHNLPFALTS